MTNGPPRDELEELFDELGELHKLRAAVQKKVLAHDIKQAMKAKGISPSEMARRMRTSREAVYRLLDPTRTGVTLDSLQRAASALGLTLNISFEPPARRPRRGRRAWLADERSGPRELSRLMGPSARVRRRQRAPGHERVEVRRRPRIELTIRSGAAHRVRTGDRRSRRRPPAFRRHQPRSAADPPTMERGHVRGRRRRRDLRRRSRREPGPDFG